MSPQLDISVAVLSTQLIQDWICYITRIVLNSVEDSRCRCCTTHWWLPKYNPGETASFSVSAIANLSLTFIPLWIWRVKGKVKESFSSHWDVYGRRQELLSMICQHESVAIELLNHSLSCLQLIEVWSVFHPESLSMISRIEQKPFCVHWRSRGTNWFDVRLITAHHTFRWFVCVGKLFRTAIEFPPPRMWPSSDVLRISLFWKASSVLSNGTMSDGYVLTTEEKRNSSLFIGCP